MSRVRLLTTEVLHSNTLHVSSAVFTRSSHNDSRRAAHEQLSVTLRKHVLTAFALPLSKELGKQTHTALQSY
jgi:hypothetical protein